jgi:serine/threonine-protein kinase
MHLTWAAARRYNRRGAMSISPGTRLGAFEVLSVIGAGGMGEVYRAHDEKLGRDVAIKVVPDLWRVDPERRARFDREARLLASLSHPHIAAIYGIEDVGELRALILELVEGETLAERLEGRGLPIPEALDIARQIADALDAAHERGVVHRDLKPANIMITPDGVVKVLDFGLAKAVGGDAGGPDLTQSPTVTGTREGIILGTAAYMSPEQARGKAVDKRTDIWAFGVVLYEMLSGRVAFSGETLPDILAAILERKPDWGALPAATPPAIHTLLRRCLEGDLKRRLRDIGDVRLEIEDALTERAPAGQAARTDGDTDRRKRLAWMAGLLAIGAVAGVVIATRARTPPAASIQAPAHFVVPLSSSERMAGLDFPAVAISPDGSLIAYVAARGGGQTELFLRPINTVESKAIAGTRNATTPFFSPDSRWIAFFADGQLKKVSTSGGVPITLCDAPVGLGGSWGPGDTIVFSAATGSGLSQVSANGGKPQPMTSLDAKKEEFSHRWPEWLPDGKTILYTVGTVGSWDDAQIVAQSLASGERRVLVQGGTNPHYLPSGHLIYARRGAILAVPFDPARPMATATPVRLLDNVVQSFDGAAQLSVSSSGTGVYIAGEFTSNQRRLVTVDRTGAATPFAAPPGAYVAPRLSPDGRKLLVTLEAATNDVWIHDITAGTLSQVTFDAGAIFPVWTPDGQRATFSSNKEGALNLFWTQIAQHGPAERLGSSENLQVPGSWSPDGGMLAFVEQEPTNGRDVWLMTLRGDPARRPFLNSRFDESAPRFSPDGHWIAYASNESGRTEVYLRSVADPARKQDVSNNGGTEPVWARSGRELFYREGDTMMAVSLAGNGPDIRVAGRQALFQGAFAKGTIDAANYDVTADDQRFVMVRAEEQASAQASLHVLINWFGAIAASLSSPPR